MIDQPAPALSIHASVSTVIAGYLEALTAGQAPDREQLLATHPDLADDLRAFFADHDKMTQAAAPVREALGDAPSPTTETFPQPFGDYELLEEVGRGGMGIVYQGAAGEPNWQERGRKGAIPYSVAIPKVEWAAADVELIGGAAESADGEAVRLADSMSVVGFFPVKHT